MHNIPHTTPTGGSFILILFTLQDVMNTMRGVGGMGVRLPREEDLHGAAQALVRLHDVYNLNTTQLARGNVWGVQSTAGEREREREREREKERERERERESSCVIFCGLFFVVFHKWLLLLLCFFSLVRACMCMCVCVCPFIYISVCVCVYLSVYLGHVCSFRADGAGLSLHGQTLLQSGPLPASRPVVWGSVCPGRPRGECHCHPGTSQRFPGHCHQSGEAMLREETCVTL